MNELNGLQRQILDEIKEDIKKNSDMSIKDFAKRHYISPAFLVNLSKKLGYSGYRELIFSFKSSHKSQPAAQDRDLAGIRNTIISNYSEEMVDTFELNASGPAISETEIADFKAKLTNLKSGDVVIMSGSLPKGLPSTFYRDLIPLIHAHDADFVIDTTGQALLDRCIPALPSMWTNRS